MDSRLTNGKEKNLDNNLESLKAEAVAERESKDSDASAEPAKEKGGFSVLC